jgi:hypothetical protein
MAITVQSKDGELPINSCIVINPEIRNMLNPSNQIHHQQQDQQVPSLVQFFTDDVSTLPSDGATYHNRCMILKNDVKTEEACKR